MTIGEYECNMDLHYLLPEKVQSTVEKALRAQLSNGFSIEFQGPPQFKYGVEFDSEVEDGFSFNGPIQHQTQDGKLIELILEASQIEPGQGEISVDGSGSDTITISSKSKYNH